LRIFLVWLALLSATPALAQEKAKLKLLFMGLQSGGGLKPEELESASSYTQSQIVALDAYRVMGQDDIRTTLGFERQKALLGCNEELSCMSELAGALDSDRAITGIVAVTGESQLITMTLMNLKESAPVSRVSKRIDSLSRESLLDAIKPAVFELISADPALKDKAIHYEREFGGVMLGVRADADMLGPDIGKQIVPSLTLEVSGKRFGGALVALIKSNPGLRLEARWYPITLGRFRPHVAAGVIGFTKGFGVRGGAGLTAHVGSFQMFLDVAYEHFLLRDPDLFLAGALVVGAGLGWLF
jgi:hypothetical protein